MLSEIKAFLGCATPEAWIQVAVQDLSTLLIDHKNNEFKAASTAMALMAKYAEHEALINFMSRLAREELRHYEQVLALLKQRNIPLQPLSAGRYASGLRSAVRTHEPQRLVDTLIVGAFIECRSCERFAALLEHLDEDLAKFYGSLLKSEGRHFQGYMKLARLYGEAEDIERRLEVFRELEASLVLMPDEQFRFHSGVPKAA